MYPIDDTVKVNLRSEMGITPYFFDICIVHNYPLEMGIDFFDENQKRLVSAKVDKDTLSALLMNSLYMMDFKNFQIENTGIRKPKLQVVK